jgi:hypothetical protein
LLKHAISLLRMQIKIKYRVILLAPMKYVNNKIMIKNIDEAMEFKNETKKKQKSINDFPSGLPKKYHNFL